MLLSKRTAVRGHSSRRAVIFTALRCACIGYPALRIYCLNSDLLYRTGCSSLLLFARSNVRGHSALRIYCLYILSCVLSRMLNIVSAGNIPRQGSLL